MCRINLVEQCYYTPFFVIHGLLKDADEFIGLSIQNNLKEVHKGIRAVSEDFL
jgi:hypothetical protein